mmetsp:Transcript_94194/g.281111  ORF Transcript_94194/g.281111 Transcript_94194/m.281111 type:complete len:370 (-) Transcript_94194:173-1282(-)
MGTTHCKCEDPETPELSISNEDVPMGRFEAKEDVRLMIGIAGASGLRDTAWLLSTADRPESGRSSSRPGSGQLSKEGCQCTVEVPMKGQSVRFRTSAASDALVTVPIWRAEIPIAAYTDGSPLRFTVTDEGGTGEILGRALVDASEFAEMGLNAELPLTGGKNSGAFLKVKIRNGGQEYPPGPPPSFKIEVEKATDQSAGLELDIQEGTMAYVLAVNPGPLSVYNKTAEPCLCLFPGYFIETVNDTKGSSSKLMDIMHAASKLTLLVRRPEDFDVLVKRRQQGEPLGLVISQRPRARTLVVSTVEAGPVQDWNNGHVDFQVRQGDRIVRVGGESGEAAELLSRLRDSQHVVLGIARPAASGPERGWRFW